eukprot:1863930-Rhodomonas_salina.1
MRRVSRLQRCYAERPGPTPQVLNPTCYALAPQCCGSSSARSACSSAGRHLKPELASCACAMLAPLRDHNLQSSTRQCVMHGGTETEGVVLSGSLSFHTALFHFDHSHAITHMRS